MEKGKEKGKGRQNEGKKTGMEEGKKRKIKVEKGKDKRQGGCNERNKKELGKKEGMEDRRKEGRK